MTSQNYHFDDHLTWQRKSDLKFLIFNWKIKLGAGRVILLIRACGHSPLPLSPNTSPRISFFFFEKSFTAPPHRSTASPFLQSALKPLCAPSSRTHTDPHHTHLFSTFSHQLVQKPQNPSQRETLTRIPLPLPLPLPLRLTPTLGRNFFCCRCSIPEPLHTPNFIT